MRQFFANNNHNFVHDHPDLSSVEHFGYGWHPDSDRYANGDRNRHQLLSSAHAPRGINTKHLNRGHLRNAHYGIRAGELHHNSIELG